MPGLLRGVARTAVVAGTATAVRGRVDRRQAETFAARDAQIYAERERAYNEQVSQRAATPAATDVLTQLKQLAELREQNVLTEEEFAAQKARILAT